MTKKRKYEPALLTLEEAADYLRVSLSTVRRLIRRRKLAAAKIGGQYRIRRQILEEMVKGVE